MTSICSKRSVCCCPESDNPEAATPLHSAVLGGDAACVEALLQARSAALRCAALRYVALPCAGLSKCLARL